MLHLLPLALVGFAAGAQNAIAGGGAFLIFPALLMVGLDARAANVTSTLALFPGQVTTGIAGRRLLSGTPALRFRWLAGISLVGGVMGALLLLATPPAFFERLVPWLILFATGVFAYGSFFRSNADGGVRIGRRGSVAAQSLISVYGGYFGGGIGFLMLAALTLAGLEVRRAAATKNVLAAAMNASAVMVFAPSPAVAWLPALAVGLGAIGGGQVGAWMLRRVDERTLRYGVICVGVALTVAMFVRAA